MSISPAETLEQWRADYAAAKQSRFRRKRWGIAPMGSGADYHYRDEQQYLHLIEQARDMDRNDAIIGTMLDRTVNQVVQTGYQLDPDTGSPELDAALLERWQEWANDPAQCDYSSELCFQDMERLSLRATYTDGDIVALPIRDGTLQWIEGHRVRTPWGLTYDNVVNGVELDARRRRVRYYITRDDISPRYMTTSSTDFNPPVPAYDQDGNRTVFHISDPERFSQTRGVTLFAPLFDLLGMTEDINFAKLVQAQTVSAFAFLRSKQAGTDVNPASQPLGETKSSTTSSGHTYTAQAIKPGMDVTTDPGEEIKGFSPNIPNPEYFPHIKLLLSIAGSRFALPWVMLMMDASETNFSGWRGAVDIARLDFRRTQSWHQGRLHRPVYQWKVRNWLSGDPAIRRLAAQTGVRPYRHNWAAPGWPYIQPKDDATADSIRQAERLTSPRRIQQERGRDFEQVAREIVADNALLAEAAILRAAEMNAAAGAQVIDWHELLNLSETPAGSPPASTTDETTEAPSDGEA